MEKNYFKFYLNLSSVVKASKIFYLFLITFLISSTSFSQSISSFTPTNACINSGASVIITGINFTGTTAVNFNGIAASFTFDSDTQITAIVPPTATTGAISIIGIVTGTSIDTFTVDPLPAAAGTITGTATVCQAQASVAYSVGAIPNATSYIWTYSGTGATITGATDNVSITFAANATSGDLTVYGVNACGNGIVSATYPIAVNPLPAAAGTISGTSTVCQTQTSVAYSVGAIPNATSYSWAYSGTGATITGSTNSVSITFAANATSGDLTVYGVNVCGNGIVSANYPLIVNPLPAAAGTIAGTSTVCQAQTSVAYSVGAIPNATSYSWAYSGTGATITGSTDTVSITFAANATSGDLTVYGVNACGNGIVSATYPITVNPLPAAAGTITGTSTVCQVQASVAYSVGAIPNATNYSWAYSGTGATITGSTNSVSITFAANATSGNLTVYGVNACGNGIASANYPITVNPLPAAAGTITGTATVCQAQTSVAYSVGAIANATSYSWAYSGTGATITGSTNSVSITFAANATAGNLTVYGVNACGNGNVSADYGITINTISLAPTGITGITTICTGDSTTLTFSGGTAGTGATAQWFSGSCGGTAAGAGNSITVSPTGNTTYFVRYNGTCNTTTCASVVVTVRPNFTAGAINAAGETICYNSDPANITSTTLASGGDGIITYKWQAGGVDIPGATSATFDPPTGLIATTTYTRWAKDNTCNTTFIQSTGSQVVTVNPNFTAGAITATAETICYSGNPANITSTTPASGGDGTITYKWQANGVDIASSNTATYDPPTGLTATTTYTRLAKDNTCNTPFTLSTGSQVVTVNPNFTAGAITATAETICYSGDPTNITSTTPASGGDGNITYKWQAGGVDIAGATGPTFDPPTGLTTTTTYTRWAKDNTCNTIFIQSTGNRIVTVRPNFTAGAINATGETICYNGNPANITSITAASGGDGTITYKWQANGADIAGATGPTFDPPIGLITTTTYTRLAKDNTCNTTFTPSTGSWIVTVRPNFIAGAITTTGETICYNGDPTNITSTTPASGGDGNITYKWQANAVDIVGATGPTFDPPTGLTATTTYTRLAKDNTCNVFTLSTGSWIVTVRPNFTAGAINAAGETICYNGDPSNITSTTLASGGDGTITYKWQAGGVDIPGATSATFDPPTGLIATTTYTRWAKDNTCNTTFIQSTGSRIVTVRPNFTPGAINATGETICYSGNPANITSTTPASGGDGTITYKWQANGVDIASSNSATYDPPTGLTATTTYTRLAKDNTCNIPFTLSTGSQVVTVNPNFTAGAINATGETICYNGDPANITSTTPASGGDGNITYKWQAGGVDIVGATGPTFDPPTGLTATTTYTRWAKDNTCTAFALSTGNRIVTVRPNFTAGAINATGETICYNGNPANITSTTPASGGDGTITYKWQANGVDIVGATSASFDPPAGLIATTVYTRWAKDNTCNTFTLSTGSRIVTVNPNFTAGAINATGETICYSGNPANITSTTPASGGDGNITYRWQANGSTITGATSATFDPPTGLTATTTYTRLAKDNTCNTTFIQSTGSQIVTVNPIFTAGAINATAETICYNGNPANIASTTAASGGDGTITYKWQAGGVDIASSNTATYDPPTGLTATTTFTRWVKDNTCNTTFIQSTGSRVVTVRPNFTAGAITATGETICYNGNPANITSITAASGGDGTITYKWQANGVDIASSNTATYDPPTGLTATTTYTRLAKDNTCNTAFTQSAGSQLITVNQLPIGSASAQTICSGGTTSVALNSTVSNTLFIWTVSTVTNPTGGTITGQLSCPAVCGNSIAQTLTNSGTTAAIIRYTITPIANTCPGATFTVDVTVNPKPVVTLPNLTGQCSVTVPVATATDNCGVTVTGATGDPLFYDIQGPHTVDWSFNFGNGIVILATQNVTVDDTEAPSANVATLPTLNVSGCEVASITAPTAYDTCKGTIYGTTTTPFPITTQGPTTVTWTYNDGNGNTSSQIQNVTLTAPAISGGTLVGSVTGLTPAATPSENIAINSCPDDINPVTMNLSGQVGTIIRWEKFEAGDTAWSIISNDTNTYSLVFNFDNTKSTLFRVVIQVGNCTTYSNMVNVHAIPPDVPPILDQSDFDICLNDSVSLVARSGYSSTINVGGGGDFDNGQFPDKWDPTQWRIDDQVAGAQWTAAGNNTKFNNWSGTNNHPVGTLYRIEYDSGDFKFGIAHGNFNSAAYIADFGVGPTTLETPLFSLVGLQTAAVEFDQAYNLHAGDIAKLELLIFAADGTTLENTIVLQNLIGTSPQANSWGPVPYPYQAPQSNNSTTTYFDFNTDNSSFDISDYIGNSNVRVKWTFFGTTDESTWAIDNISIPVRPYFDDVEWTDGLGEPGEYIIRNKLEAVYTFVPSAPGVHLYGATSLINGCRAYDPDGTAIATVKVNFAYAGQAQGYTNAECGERTVNLNAYDNTKSANENNDFGAYPTLVRNDFSDDPGTGATGKWTVFNTTNTCGTYSFSDDVSPTSSFSGDAGVYTLRWTLVASGCYSDVLVTLTSCDVIDFDGVNDYVEFNKNSYGLGSDFGIEVWVKPEPQPANPVSTIQTIISKRNANSLIDGYDLRLTGNSLSFNWNNGSQLISPFPLSTSRWYHVAITRTGGFYRLYVDGIEVINASGSAPLSNTSTCIAGAMDQSGNPPNRPVHHFSGWMDELRIWDKGLDPHHVRQMMNQQIIDNGTAVRGEIIPIDINGPDANNDGIDDLPLTWSNLLGYYRMNLIDCGYLKPFAGKGADGKLRNITSSQEETAPLPYISIRDGNWTDRNVGTSPWKYGHSVWDYPNSTGYLGAPIDWNIVQTAHNINSGNKDITVLGLISSAGKLTIADPAVTDPIENNDGQGLWITLYLKLNGTIDLVGESQLVQKRYGVYTGDNLFSTTQFSESIFDATSLGYIERDQQGKQNSFNYNYWSSPVSSIQGIINNTPYSLSGVLRDGTDSSSPGTIEFNDGAFFADGDLTIPIKTSNRWLWAYNSATPDSNTDLQDYNQWNYLGSTGLLKTGEGFTMKGSGGTADINALQNYVFIGKPNSGTIALPFGVTDQTYLVGNPYPSALDADEFIADNLAGRAGVNVFNGALYFWDHFGVSDNHILAEYEGGYATYTLAGGVRGINNSSLNLNDLAEGDKVPGRYIPVGQSFFVDAAIDPSIEGTTTTVDGGTLIFKNSQRIFIREDATNSVFMKKSGTKKTKTTAKDTRSKIRLGFDAATGMHRQLLVAADSNATNNFDIGYDAQMFDVSENDMYWEFSNSEFVIQALPHFNADQIIPIGLAIANEGEVTIKIDSLENIPETTAIYLHDNSTATYHNIKKSDFKITLAIGEYKDRFSLQFTSKSLDLEENILNDGLEVLYSKNYKVLIIQNKIPDVTVQDVQLFNLLGQAIENWDVEDREQTTIKIPVKNVSSGVYIVKVKTSQGQYSKKIIIN